MKYMYKSVLLFLVIVIGISFQSANAENDYNIVIYSDLSYPTSWWGHDYALVYKQYLTDTFDYFEVEYTIADATTLAEIIASSDPLLTVIIPTQDVLPDTVWDGKDNSIIEKWLKDGGTLAWTGDSDFFFVGHNDGTSGYGDSSEIYGKDIGYGMDVVTTSTEIGRDIIPSYAHTSGFVSLNPVSVSKLSGLDYEVYGETTIQGVRIADPIAISIGKGKVAKIGMTGGELDIGLRGVLVSEYVLNKVLEMNITILDSSRLDEIERLVIGEYHNWYSGSPQWRHWAESGHNPDTPVYNGYKDIASANYPVIGPYDSGDRDLIEYHIELAKYAGIDAFAVDWYGKESFEDESVDFLLDVANEKGFKIALEFEPKVHFEWIPHATRGQALEAIQQEIRHIFKEYIDHEAYLKIMGEPVIFIYGSGYLGVEEWNQMFQSLMDEGYYAKYVAETSEIWYYNAFDGLYEWINLEPPGHQTSTQRLSNINEYFEDTSLFYPGKFYGSGVWPGFDDSGVDGWGGGTRTYPREDGEHYEEMWETVLNDSPSFVMVMTFNDWNEGTQIEPSMENGYGYIETTRNYASRYKGESSQKDLSPLHVSTNIVRAERYYVGSDATVSFGFRWFNDEPVFGELIIDGQTIETDINGKVSYTVSSSMVEEKEIVLNHIKVAGKEHPLDESSISIVFDRLKVTDIGVSSEQVTTGEPVTIWCKVEHEYDSTSFDENFGTVYINDKPMEWNDNRWEITHIEENAKTESFAVTRIESTQGAKLPVNTDTPNVNTEWKSKGIPGYPVYSMLIGLLILTMLISKNH